MSPFRACRPGYSGTPERVESATYAGCLVLSDTTWPGVFGQNSDRPIGMRDGANPHRAATGIRSTGSEGLRRLRRSWDTAQSQGRPGSKREPRPRTPPQRFPPGGHRHPLDWAAKGSIAPLMGVSRPTAQPVNVALSCFALPCPRCGQTRRGCQLPGSPEDAGGPRRSGRVGTSVPEKNRGSAAPPTLSEVLAMLADHAEADGFSIVEVDPVFQTSS